jgi:hypothetical protein
LAVEELDHFSEHACGLLSMRNVAAALQDHGARRTTDETGNAFRVLR